MNPHTAFATKLAMEKWLPVTTLMYVSTFTFSFLIFISILPTFHTYFDAIYKLQCKIEWFHFGCVGLKEQPKGKWYCSSCAATRNRRRGK